MSAQHTPEPWPEFNDRADGLEYGKNNERIYSVSLYEHDYNRARACVNACAGIDTAFLIAWAHGVQQNDGKPWADRIDENLSEIHAIKQQRDELLVENRWLVVTMEWLSDPENKGGITTCRKHNGYGFHSDCAICSRLNAIAKARQQS